MGPTLLDFEILYKTDTKTMGTIFIVHQTAYLVGAVLSGFIIDRFNQELLFTIAALLSGFAVMGSPWLPNLIAFIFSLGILKGAGGGFIDSGKYINWRKYRNYLKFAK